MGNALLPRSKKTCARKNQIQNHPTISINNIQVERTTFQKHLGLILDEKLNFKQHVDSAISKVNKGISVIKKLRHTFPRKSLINLTFTNFVKN